MYIYIHILHTGYGAITCISNNLPLRLSPLPGNTSFCAVVGMKLSGAATVASGFKRMLKDGPKNQQRDRLTTMFDQSFPTTNNVFF